MSNIAQNILRTAQLARRLANSRSWSDLDWKSMMNEIYGTRTEGVDILKDAAGTAGIGESAIELGGLGILGWLAVLVAILFTISLLLFYLMPLFTDIPPPAAPHVADAIRSAPSEEALRQMRQYSSNDQGAAAPLTPAQELNKEIIERGGAYPGMIPGKDTLDEGELQRQRMQAIASGDMNRYNQIVEEHRKLYKEHGVDPCQSGFFPQGCE